MKTAVYPTKVHFKNLDALRFFAFFAVFIFHAFPAQNNPVTQTTLYQSIFWFARMGYLGVNFFFVLSGFLITYLLLDEKRRTGTIHVGQFYMRRVLRIWPLYYLLIAIGFLIYPYVRAALGEHTQPDPASPWLYVFFLSNFDNIYHPTNTPSLYVLWSIAIEEQFYLVWPLLMHIVHWRFKWALFAGIVLMSLAARSVLFPDGKQLYFNTLSVIGDMAIGGWLAWCAFTQNVVHRFLSRLPRPAIILVYLAGCALVLTHERWLTISAPGRIIERFIIGAFFGFIIFEQTFSKNSFAQAGRIKLLSALGKITYGLYCYHLLCLVVVHKAAAKVHFGETALTYLILNVIGLLLTIGVAQASYYVFERPFLKLKERFSPLLPMPKAESVAGEA